MDNFFCIFISIAKPHEQIGELVKKGCADENWPLFHTNNRYRRWLVGFIPWFSAFVAVKKFFFANLTRFRGGKQRLMEREKNGSD